MSYVAVQYIGKKEKKEDTVAGTGLVWFQGQVHFVPPIVAAKLLKYPDAWKEVDPDSIEDPAIVGMMLEESDINNPTKIIREDTHMPNFESMDKQALIAYGRTQFGIDIAPQTKEENIRAKLTNLFLAGKQI